jgi:Protein of unknown function (DUF2778)
MWTYYQTGALFGSDGVRLEAYSGKGEYKNKPEAQNIKNWGPLPCGVYRIGDPFDDPIHGPDCLRLTPDAANEMYGRDGFLIHGDSIAHPGTASEGCVVTSRANREKIHLSQDRELHVLPSEPVALEPVTEET